MSQFRFRPVLALALCLAMLVACGPTASGDPPQISSVSASSSGKAAPSSSVASSASSSASAEEPAAGGKGDGSGGGQKAKRFGEATVYIDGKPTAVLRIHEMPPTLLMHPQKLEDGRMVSRYRLGEYLEKVGVDLNKLQELHLIGGRNRTSVISGKELRKHAKTLLFSFSRGDSGKARIEWPGTPIEVNTTIDTIVAIAAYQALTPPKYDREKKSFFDENGKVFEGIPYTKPEDSLRGTRVYVDGKLLASVKRKKLPDSVLSDSYTPQNPMFSLEKYLRSLDLDPDKIKHVIALRGDFVVHHFDPAEWKKDYKKAEFSLSQGAEGRMLLHLPEAPEKGRQTSAIVIFQANVPPKRILEAPADQDQGGSPANQGEPD